MAPSDFALRVERVVYAIPRGRVMTYGDVAAAAGAARAARAVGTLLRTHLTSPDLPWHRVINASGGISFKGDVERAEEQRRRLVDEGHSLDERLKLDLATVRWRDLPAELLESPDPPKAPPRERVRRLRFVEDAESGP